MGAPILRDLRAGKLIGALALALALAASVLLDPERRSVYDAARGRSARSAPRTWYERPSPDESADWARPSSPTRRRTAPAFRSRFALWSARLHDRLTAAPPQRQLLLALTCCGLAALLIAWAKPSSLMPAEATRVARSADP